LSIWLRRFAVCRVEAVRVAGKGVEGEGPGLPQEATDAEGVKEDAETQGEGARRGSPVKCSNGKLVLPHCCAGERRDHGAGATT
jgi:hypothetical protein